MEACGETVMSGLAVLAPERLAPLLAAEAPPVAAAVLLLLPPERAARVLEALPQDGRRPVLRALATAVRPPADVRDALAGALRAALGEDRAGAPALAIVEHLAPDLRDDALVALSPPARTTARPPAAVPAAVPSSLPGLAALLDARRVWIDRMPMLEVVVDRFARILASGLRGRLGRPVEVGLLALRSVRFGDWMAQRAQAGSLFAVARAAAWSHCALVLPDRAALDAAVAALAGGRGDAEPGAGDRPLTALDRALAGLAADCILECLGAAFAPVGDVAFALDRLEEDGRHAWIDRPHNAVVVADLSVAVDDRLGRLEVLLPCAALEPVRDALRAMFAGERFGEDPLWRAHLRRELALTDADVCALAGHVEVALSALLAWRPGTVVALDGRSGWQEGGQPAGWTGDVVLLQAGGVAVLRGRLDRCGDRRSVRTDRAGEGGGVPATAATEMDTAGPAVPPAAGDRRDAVTVPVAIRLGQGVLSMAALLDGALPGEIVLDRGVGDPVEVLAAGRPVARGALVRLCGGGWGVRLSQMAPAAEPA